MKSLISIASVILIMSCSESSRTSSVTLKEEEEKIVQCWNDWPEKVKAGDPTYYWSDDAMIMGQGQPTIKGKNQIQNMMKGMEKVYGFKITWDEQPSDIEISPDGQMAYLLAKNEVSMADSTGTSNKIINQALQIWKKDDDGNWKASVVVMYPKVPIHF